MFSETFRYLWIRLTLDDTGASAATSVTEIAVYDEDPTSLPPPPPEEEGNGGSGNGNTGESGRSGEDQDSGAGAGSGGCGSTGLELFLPVGIYLMARRRIPLSATAAILFAGAALPSFAQSPQSITSTADFNRGNPEGLVTIGVDQLSRRRGRAMPPPHTTDSYMSSEDTKACMANSEEGGSRTTTTKSNSLL